MRLANRGRLWLGATLLLLLGVGLLTAVGAGAAHKKMPDLSVEVLSVAPDSVVAGGNVTVKERTVNKGRRKTKGSSTGYYLGSSRKLADGDVRLGQRTVDGLKKGKESSGQAELTIPGEVTPGNYWLLACADASDRVNEAQEDNNCDSARIEVKLPSNPADVNPPTFAGLVAATANSESQITLDWGAATDDVTPAGEIKYDVFEGTASGATGSVPVKTVTGTTTTQITGLSPDTAYYFVVLARDAAGNRSNTAMERSAQTFDSTPPVFGGITSAQGVGACGVANGDCRAKVTWNAASDAGTPTAEIVYDIYRGSTTHGSENFSTPTYTSDPGATSFTAPVGDTYIGCWVVRARDRRGNRDTNTTEICAQPVP